MFSNGSCHGFSLSNKTLQSLAKVPGIIARQSGNFFAEVESLVNNLGSFLIFSNSRYFWLVLIQFFGKRGIYFASFAKVCFVSKLTILLVYLSVSYVRLWGIEYFQDMGFYTFWLEGRVLEPAHTYFFHHPQNLHLLNVIKGVVF